jgi:hypothetical protein
MFIWNPALTGCSLWWRRNVFPVRYGLNPYILFRRNSVLKVLINSDYSHCTVCVRLVMYLWRKRVCILLQRNLIQNPASTYTTVSSYSLSRLLHPNFEIVPWNYRQPGLLSRYSHGLWAGLTGFNSQQGQVILLCSIAYSPALGPTQPPIQWVLGAVSSGGKAAGVWCWPLTSIYCRGQEWWLYNSTPLYVFMA